jgi:hypothetical protein
MPRDTKTTRRPDAPALPEAGRPSQRINVDFPPAFLEALDREATRLGVTRQAFIKLSLAKWFPDAK